MEENLEIHTDGGSRGNPGPAACAFVVEKNNKEIFSGSKSLGVQTNNYAEYSGVLLALDWLTNNKQFTIYNLQFLLDSELVVKQLTGLYKIKNEALLKLNQQIKMTISKNNLKVTFKNVPREKNIDADLLVNVELDQNH